MATMTTVPAKANMKQVIVYTGERMAYLEAREFVRDKGGLPSNVFHDNVLIRSDDWRTLRDYYSNNAAWTREILVHPAQDGQFKREDVVDAFEDERGRKWVFLASLIPDAAFETKSPSLFVNPGNDKRNIEVTDKRVAIIAPESVVVLSPSIQVSEPHEGQAGIVNEATRVPLFVEEDKRNNLAYEEKRSLRRRVGAGVRPLARGFMFDTDTNGRQDIYAYYDPDMRFGVGWVSLETDNIKQVQTSWLAALRKDADEVEAHFSELTLSQLAVVQGTLFIRKVKDLIRNARTVDIEE